MSIILRIAPVILVLTLSQTAAAARVNDRFIPEKATREAGTLRAGTIESVGAVTTMPRLFRTQLAQIVIQAVPSEGPVSGQSPSAAPSSPGKSAKDEKGPESKPADAASSGTPAKDGEKKGDKKEGEKKDASEPAVVSRPLNPEKPGDPDQLKVVPDENGRVRFNFAGQRWRDVMEWLAGVSQLSLDWQELPGDYLNLRTQRDYTILEAQDLINRHLLARGFTMIKSGEILTVTSIAKLNPAFVPRVEPAELPSRMDYEFVKVSFPMKWILAEALVEEIRPMLSSNGKISALKEVNRIEAMDAAVNLKEIARLLQQEQSPEAAKGTVVKEFKLLHRRASDVLAALESILGLDKNRPAAGGGRGGDGMSMQIMQQMQQMQQMIQQQQQRGNQPGGGKNTQQEEPRLIINDRENSILAHAPPDKMEVIEQTIRAMDVPGSEETPLLQNLSRIKSYRLTTLDPQPLAIILKDMGDLSPQARIQVDEKSRSLILYGNLSDHLTVTTLIQRLDGSNRSFEVIQLRRVQADAVAGTIQYLMGAEDKDSSRNSGRSMYSYFYNPPSRDSENEDKRPFKVDADVDANRLLVWANESELQEIRQLLTKMGEVFPGEGQAETRRTFEVDSDAEAERILERLRQVWPDLEPNALQIQPSAKKHPLKPEEEHLKSGPRPAESKGHQTRNTVGASELNDVLLQLVAVETKPADLPKLATSQPHPLAMPAPVERPEIEIPLPATAKPATEIAADTSSGVLPTASTPAPANSTAPPITIKRGVNGKLIYESADTTALDRLEELLNELSPASRDYKVFHLKYPTTWAFGVEYNLKEFFKEKSNQERSYDPWGWGYSSSSNRKSESLRLSKRRELKIISDDDSRTILVQGATPQQLSTIADLIELYDVPMPGDPQSIRRTRILGLKHSKADQIAETIKQVYRDLLSANDPSLQSNNPNQQQQRNERTITYNFGNDQNKDPTKDPKQPVKYKGLLSVGVDEISNSVIISAGEELLAEIEQMVRDLDEAAHPHINIQVLQVKNLDTSIVKERLDKSFAPTLRKSETGHRKPQNPPPQQPPQQQQDSVFDD